MADRFGRPRAVTGVGDPRRPVPYVRTNEKHAVGATGSVRFRSRLSRAGGTRHRRGPSACAADSRRNVNGRDANNRNANIREGTRLPRICKYGPMASRRPFVRRQTINFVVNRERHHHPPPPASRRSQGDIRYRLNTTTETNERKGFASFKIARSSRTLLLLSSFYIT